jgi:hypothetical protein
VSNIFTALALCGIRVLIELIIMTKFSTLGKLLISKILSADKGSEILASKILFSDKEIRNFRPQKSYFPDNPWRELHGAYSLLLIAQRVLAW